MLTSAVSGNHLAKKKYIISNPRKKRTVCVTMRIGIDICILWTIRASISELPIYIDIHWYEYKSYPCSIFNNYATYLIQIILFIGFNNKPANMPFWQKTGAKITPAKKVPSMSSSMTSLSPSQLNAAIMDMLNVNNTGNQCINACRGKTGWYLDINCCEMYRRHNDCP